MLREGPSQGGPLFGLNQTHCTMCALPDRPHPVILHNQREMPDGGITSARWLV